MKTAKIVKFGFTAGAFLLISTAANAQSAQASRTSHQTTSAHSRDAQSGMASGKYQRKNGAIQSADFDRNTREHTHGSPTPSSPQTVNKGNNPLYEDHGKSGDNPMFEGNRSAAAGTGTSNGANPHPPSQVKGTPIKGVSGHGEHGLNRQEAQTPSESGSNSGPDMYQRKHIAGVKYQDRAASGDKMGPDMYQRKHISGVKYQDRTAHGSGTATGENTPKAHPRK